MVVRLTDAPQLRRLFAEHPVRDLELLDALDRDGLDALGVWADDGALPGNVVAVRWQAGPLGMTHAVHVLARRIRELDAVIDALPRGGTYELTCPFWAAPALEQVFRTELQGPVASYVLPEGALGSHPAARQTIPFGDEDLGLVAYAFPRALPGAPHRALVLRDELVAVAVTTAAAEGYARIGVHVVETSRGHGFGGAVAHALCADLLGQGLTPTAVVALADEPAVRLVEGLGMIQAGAEVKVTGVGRRASEHPT